MMQNPLPPIEEFIGDDITEGDFKVALVKLRAYLDELLGTDGEGHNVVPASVGSATNPVYTDANKNIVASNATVGATNKPVYMNNGKITAISGNIGSASQPVYIANGVLTATDMSGSYVKVNNGALAVGSYGIGGVYTKNKTVANGGTIAGSDLRMMSLTGHISTGINRVTPSGTWRNVSGGTVGTSSSVGTLSTNYWSLWQRIA